MKFLTSNEPLYRFLRTVIQGLLAAVILYLPEIVGHWQLGATEAALLTAVIMAVLSPLMGLVGGDGKEEEHGD